MIKNRYTYIDFLKIFACMMVIINHTNSDIFLNRAPSATWFVSLAYFFMSKPAVPLFLMCSGAVLLGKNESYKKVFLRVGKITLVTLLFSVISIRLIPDRHLAFHPDSIGSFFKNIMEINITNAYWYLYLYIGILLMLPICRRLVSALNKNDFIYMIILTCLIPGLLPLLDHYTGIKISYNIISTITWSLLTVFMAGYFIHKFVKPKKYLAITSIGIFVLLLLIQILGTYVEYTKNAEEYLVFDNRILITIILCACCLFYLAKYVFSRYNSAKASKYINFISAHTFGIYLLSDILISCFQPVRIFMNSLFHPLISVILNQLLVFLSGFAITFLLKKIKYVNQLI